MMRFPVVLPVMPVLCSQYYRNVGKRSEETLANYGALAIVRPDLVDMLRKDKPELVEALDEVIQEMLKKVGG